VAFFGPQCMNLQDKLRNRCRW